MNDRLFAGTLNKSIKRFGEVLPACTNGGNIWCSYFKYEKNELYCIHVQFLSHSEQFEEHASCGYFCRHVNAFCLAQEADSIRKLEEI